MWPYRSWTCGRRVRSRSCTWCRWSRCRSTRRGNDARRPAAVAAAASARTCCAASSSPWPSSAWPWPSSSSSSSSSTVRDTLLLLLLLLLIGDNEKRNPAAAAASRRPLSRVVLAFGLGFARFHCPFSGFCLWPAINGCQYRVLPSFFFSRIAVARFMDTFIDLAADFYGLCLLLAVARCRSRRRGRRRDVGRERHGARFVAADAPSRSVLPSFFYCFTEFYPRTIELMRDDSTSTFSSLMAGPIEFLSGYRRLGRLFTELLPGFTVQSRPTG